MPPGGAGGLERPEPAGGRSCPAAAACTDFWLWGQGGGIREPPPRALQRCLPRVLQLAPVAMHPGDEEAADTENPLGDATTKQSESDVGTATPGDSLYAKLAEAPTNWHQASVYALISRDPADADLRSRAVFQFLMGILMVFGQCVVLPRLFQSQIASPCQTSDQCDKQGTFCSKAGGWQKFGSGGCVYCGT